MKLAALVFAFAAVPASAQSSPRGGIKLGSVAVYLAKPPEVPEPNPGPDADDAAQFRALFIRQDLRAQALSLADCNGALALALKPSDTATRLQLSQMPCAEFETWAEERSSEYAESVQTGFTSVDRTEGKIVLRRFVRDGLRQVYVSYAATVETLPGGTYRVSFGPSSDPPVADVRGNAGWKLISPPHYPVPQIVRDEDSIRLELYADGPPENATRELVDYIHAGREDRMAMRKEAPRDYYADDAELAISQPRFRVNGVACDSVVALPETIRGPVLWVYFPGYGRYILSLHARAELGFRSAGEAAGNSLTFTAEGNIFRIDTAERVAAGSGTYTIHMLPDLGWMPADPLDRARVMIGAGPGA